MTVARVLAATTLLLGTPALAQTTAPPPPASDAAPTASDGVPKASDSAPTASDAATGSDKPKPKPAAKGDGWLRVGLLGQLARVVSLLHRSRLLHRDLKPDNVLLRNPNDPAAGVSVIDFGLANERRAQEEGSLGFRAPEQSIARELNLGAAADIFALGQIGHWLLTGAPAALDRDLLTPAWEPHSAAGLSEDPRLPPALRPILKAALSYKPEQRPRASELASTLMRLRDFGGKRSG